MKNTIVIILFYLLTFKGISQNNLQVFYGNLHSHTSFSDGQLTPHDAYTYAKEIAGLDFLAVTDHMEQLSTSEYNQTQASAQSHSINGEFIAIFGYEWGSPYYGHCNVYNQLEMPGVLTYSNWSGFRSWLEARPDAIAEFNHPGDESYFNNWYDFEYKGEKTDSSFALIEFQNIEQATNWYELALNKGWHLSPVWNQDNHSADWGTKNNGRAGIWAEELTLNSLLESIRKGRTFATMDKNASVWIESENYQMGNRMPTYTGMPLRVILNDQDNETWETIELVTNDGVIASFSSISNIDTIVSPNLNHKKYIFVRAIQSDGDYIWSAPIYLTENITKVSNALKDNSINIFPNPAQTEFTIQTSENLEDAMLEITSLSGQIIHRQTINIIETQKIILPDELSNGMYIISINSHSQKFTTLLRIQK